MMEPERDVGNFYPWVPFDTNEFYEPAPVQSLPELQIKRNFKNKSHFHVLVNVQQLNVDDISMKYDKDYLIIQSKYNEKKEHGYDRLTSFNYVRRVKLPTGVNMNYVDTWVSKDCSLNILAPIDASPNNDGTVTIYYPCANSKTINNIAKRTLNFVQDHRFEVMFSHLESKTAVPPAPTYSQGRRIPPSVNIPSSACNIRASAGNVASSAGNSRTPTGNICAPVGSTHASASYTHAPTGSAYASAGNAYAPASNTRAFPGLQAQVVTCAPANNTQAPATNTFVPASNTFAPANNTHAPATSTFVPASNTCAPANNTHAPANNTRAPASNTRAPTARTNTSATNTATPASHGDNMRAAPQIENMYVRSGNMYCVPWNGYGQNMYAIPENGCIHIMGAGGNMRCGLRPTNSNQINYEYDARYVQGMYPTDYINDAENVAPTTMFYLVPAGDYMYAAEMDPDSINE